MATSNPVAYPGNGRVGDAVLLFAGNSAGKKQDVLRRGVIVAVGIPNKHGYRVNVRVQWEDNNGVQEWDTFNHDGLLDKEYVAVLPAQLGLPDSLQAYCKVHDLVAVRASGNNDYDVYVLHCPRCNHQVHEREEMISQAEIRIAASGWYRKKQDVVDCTVTLQCTCDDSDYPLPKELEDG